MWWSNLWENSHKKKNCERIKNKKKIVCEGIIIIIIENDINFNYIYNKP